MRDDGTSTSNTVVARAAYDILDRLGVVKQTSFAFAEPVPLGVVESSDLDERGTSGEG